MSIVEIILFILYITLSVKIIYLRKWMYEICESTDKTIEEIVKVLEERVKK
jgi:hypothetical protein